MGKAAEIALRHCGRNVDYVRRLRDQLEQALLQSCPDARVNGDRENRLSNTLNISFKYLEGESLLVLLDQHGICASTGSACTAGSSEPSHVLRAMGVPAEWLQGAIRFSLSELNTAEEISFVNEKVPLVVQRLQGLSALGKLASHEQGKTAGAGAGPGIVARG
jgi:cysteine desulfurase